MKAKSGSVNHFQWSALVSSYRGRVKIEPRLAAKYYKTQKPLENVEFRSNYAYPSILRIRRVCQNTFRSIHFGLSVQKIHSIAKLLDSVSFMLLLFTLSRESRVDFDANANKLLLHIGLKWNRVVWWLYLLLEGGWSKSFFSDVAKFRWNRELLIELLFFLRSFDARHHIYEVWIHTWAHVPIFFIE